MININSYEDNAFEFYRAVVDTCKARIGRPGFKHEMSGLDDRQKTSFAQYDHQFTVNDLQSLTPIAYDNQERADLRSLYAYRKKKIRELRLLLTLHPKTSRQFNTCQNCTINEVDTMDHLVPQEDFAEFAIHPKNLFPSCTACNRMKNNVWRDEGRRVFLNLYLDPLPKVQFLFVSFTTEWLPKFTMNNYHGIDPAVYEIIESHYQRLNLLERFTGSSHEVISTLTSSIKSQAAHIPIEIIRQTIYDECAELKPILGHNHWKTILKEALASQDGLIPACISETI